MCGFRSGVAWHQSASFWVHGWRKQANALGAVPSRKRADCGQWNGLGIDIDPDLPAAAGCHLDSAVKSITDPFVRVKTAGELFRRHGTDVALDPAGVRVVVIDKRRVRPQIIKPPAHGVRHPAFAASHIRALGGQGSVNEKKVHPRPSFARIATSILHLPRQRRATIDYRGDSCERGIADIQALVAVMLSL